ncbi:MAG: AAA family ATPase [Solirubrobacterales bacterium]|nr:AAA family ATPase [Solirubrobacterales bacterium]
MIRIVLAVNDNRLADHLSGLASESDELEVASILRDPQELRGALPRTDIDAVVVHDRRGAMPLIEITRELTVAHPDLGLVLVVSEPSADVLRSGMQAGARDVIAEPIGLEQLETSVLAAAAWTQALRRRAARDAHGELVGLGRVVTVVGAKGGVGTTTVAVHLALAARELGEASVCLVEYDLQAGDLRAFLDLPYRRSVVDLTAVADELTTRHLQETLYTHATGMRVLLGPQEGEQADLVSAGAARNILTAIRTREDLTIVDAGATLTEASAIAVEMADTVLIVTTPDVVALRGVSRLCALWDRLKVEPPEIAVLLNRTSRRLEVPSDLARRVVPVPVLQTTVASDFFSLESAINTGIPAAGAASDTMLRPMAGVLGEISALRPATPQGSESSAKRIAARFAGESGQATVEFVGLLPIALAFLIVVWQIALFGLTFVFAGHAARAGARALAVGDAVTPAAVKDVPGSWHVKGVQQYVQQTCDQNAPSSSAVVDGCVTVSVDTPLLVPGLFGGMFDHVLPPINASASTVIEDAALPSEQQYVLNTTVSGGCAAPATRTGAGTSLVLTPKQYVNPFAQSGSLVPERIDMGVDYSGSGPINAIGDATVEFVSTTTGWPGSYYIAYRLDDGPDAGKFVYVAEDVTAVVHEGQQVKAGQPIAFFGPNEGHGIETGWALPAPPGAYAPPVSASYYHEGMRTAGGQAFSDFMVSIGAPGGCAEGRPVVGSYTG